MTQQAVLDWTVSVTAQFLEWELAQLRDQDAETLIQRLRISDGVVVLRVLAELLAHGEVEKMQTVGNDPEVSALWKGTIFTTFSNDMKHMLFIMPYFRTKK